MTDFDHADISRRLALAVGWERRAVQLFNPPNDGRVVVWTERNFRLFDYRDPAVIWPIAERFNAFPKRSGDEWVAWSDLSGVPTFADTAALAVALAVIKAKESK